MKSENDMNVDGKMYIVIIKRRSQLEYICMSIMLEY